MEREERKEVDILDLLAALYAGKGLVIGGTLAMCVLAGALTFLIPREFESTVQILPPKEQKQGFGFSDLLSALPIPTLRLGEKGTPADIFVATLKSQLTRRLMIEKFGLLARYEAETMTDAVEILADKTTVDKTDDGTILIAVLDQDPQMAADMAMHYTVVLDSTNQRISQITASERLDFIRLLLDDEDQKLEAKMEKLTQWSGCGTGKGRCAA